MQGAGGGRPETVMFMSTEIEYLENANGPHNGLIGVALRRSVRRSLWRYLAILVLIARPLGNMICCLVFMHDAL
jgi:hypothetical protein